MPSGTHTKATLVPNRNAIMLTLAAGLAGTTYANAIAIGLQVSPGEVYPDCSPDFLDAFETMQRLALGTQDFDVLAPLISYRKWDVIAAGEALGVRWSDTWSCYQKGVIHCGHCPNCGTRHRGFIMAQVNDPTEYAA